MNFILPRQTFYKICAFTIGFFSIASLSAQDSTQLRNIDDLVGKINNSGFQPERDTVHNDQPDYGIATLTYLTVIRTGTELKKYQQEAHIRTTANGVTNEIVSTSSYYYDQSQLIKVEEHMTKDGKDFDMLWYFSNNKPLYYTLKTEKAAARAEFLLLTSKMFLEKLNR